MARIETLAITFRFCLIFFFVFPASALSLELTLEQAVNIAFENNADLRIEKKQLENAVSNVAAEKADYIPVADMNLFYNHIKEKYETGRITRDDEDYEFSIAQNLPLGGEFTVSYGSRSASVVVPGTEKYSSRINVVYKHRLLKDGLFAPAFARTREAEFDRSIQSEAVEGFRIELANDVANAFFALLRYQKMKDVNQQMTELSGRVLDLVLARFELGLSSEIDVMEARIETRTSRENLLVSIQLLEEAVRSVKTLLCIEDNVTAIGGFAGETDAIDVEEALSQATQNNKYLARLEREVEKRKLEVAISRNRVLPDVELFAGVTMTGRDDAFDKTDDFDGKDYQVGLAVSYPFHNAKLKADVAIKKRELDIFEIEYGKARIDLTNLVKSLVSQLSVVGDRMKNCHDQSEIIRERLDLAMKAFDHGLISIDRFYDARDDLLNAENRSLSISMEYCQKRARLMALTGELPGPLSKQTTSWHQ